MVDTVRVRIEGLGVGEALRVVLIVGTRRLGVDGVLLGPCPAVPLRVGV